MSENVRIMSENDDINRGGNVRIMSENDDKLSEQLFFLYAGGHRSCAGQPSCYFCNLSKSLLSKPIILPSSATPK